jgi:integral membrane protein
MLQMFRITGYLEGISYLLLLGIGVPLKYIAHNDSWVKALGMPHGLLFGLYIFMSLALRDKMQWDFKSLVTIMIASIIPFGTFYVDRKFLTNS